MNLAHRPEWAATRDRDAPAARAPARGDGRASSRPGLRASRALRHAPLYDYSHLLLRPLNAAGRPLGTISVISGRLSPSDSCAAGPTGRVVVLGWGKSRSARPHAEDIDHRDRWGPVRALGAVASSSPSCCGGSSDRLDHAHHPVLAHRLDQHLPDDPRRPEGPRVADGLRARLLGVPPAQRQPPARRLPRRSARSPRSRAATAAGWRCWTGRARSSWRYDYATRRASSTTTSSTCRRTGTC